jgi:hypothetical protein
MDKPTTRKETWNGSKWIRPEKRLAIYLRDGMACTYCGAAIEDGTQLSLDHVRPHSLGGGNDAKNLVTCCSRCNSSRGNRPVTEFAVAVATYLNHGVTAAEILRHVHNCTRRVLSIGEAKTLIACRSSAARVLASRR